MGRGRVESEFWSRQLPSQCPSIPDAQGIHTSIMRQHDRRSGSDQICQCSTILLITHRSKKSVFLPYTMTDSRIDEETPLLFSAEDPTATTSEESAKVSITPLPKLRIGILLSVLLVEPICSQCIYPFINQVTHYPDRTPLHA